ncbi:hypothetical protein [Rhodopirellula sp. UBA1907]|uniref:hypothetical protein n=1 Tax=Rhodopirellula sp. UBA1907 TaxID=1947381 RepID=UPI00257F5857|nr:hypothetical protein [Rhodopirellula sp. UBA1907]
MRVTLYPCGKETVTGDDGKQLPVPRKFIDPNPPVYPGKRDQQEGGKDERK